MDKFGNQNQHLMNDIVDSNDMAINLFEPLKSFISQCFKHYDKNASPIHDLKMQYAQKFDI